MFSSMKLLICLLCNLLYAAKLVECSWGSPGEGQYHIQTDEGPERFFRFQTDNGQFRKERRLQDGTVIGTEAWIDAAGFLRQKDYIADTQGYRILKSKTVFVGQGRQIEDAIKSTKSIPAQSGVLVDGALSPRNSIDHSTEHKHSAGGFIYSTTPIPASTTTPTPSSTTTTSAPPRASGYLTPAQAAKLEPTPYLGYDHYPDELPHRYPARPVVHIRPHSEPIDTGDYIGDQQNTLAEHDYYTTSARPILAPVPSRPSLSMEPPLPPSNRRRIRPIAVVATTPSPITANAAAAASPPYAPSTPSTVYVSGYSTPSPFAGVLPSASTTAAPGYYYAPQPTAPSVGGSLSSNVALPYDVNNLEVLQPPHLPTHYRNRGRPQLPSQVHSNAIGADNESSPPLDGEYDGVAVTRNGFRYYLPRQYHEEETFDEQKRAGSFGYVDPFGIRRVIYYNASPERGFVHRKNNRYVGFNAAPYDPRPTPY